MILEKYFSRVFFISTAKGVAEGWVLLERGKGGGGLHDASQGSGVGDVTQKERGIEE